MRPNFEYYVTSLDQWPFEVGVDLTLRERAPLAAMPHRVHIRLELNHPSDDGLSTKEEDALLFAVEDEVLNVLSPDEYRLVALVTHRCARTLVLYSQRSADDHTAIDRVMKAITTHSTTVMFENDASWTEYIDVLYPDESMLHQIQDRRVLKEFERRGDDPGSVHRIEPRFIGLNESKAKTLAGLLETQGCKIASMGPSGENGQGDWALTATLDSPLGMAVLDEFRASWIAAAHDVGGAYQGWSAEVVPVSGKNNDFGARGHLYETDEDRAERLGDDAP